MNLCKHSSAEVEKPPRFHGMQGTPAWRSWRAMKDRCTNPHSASWRNYGGRGIAMDPSWDYFPNFLRDMGERPEGCSLGRIDNDGPYTKDNCRWETKQEQDNNRRTSRFIEHGGKRMTAEQWSREIGISSTGLAHRLNAGWSVQEALTAGNSRGKKNPVRLISCDGLSQTLDQWAAQTGIGYETLQARLRRGWSAEKAIKTPVDRRFSHE